MAKLLTEKKNLSITMPIEHWNIITDYISDTILEFIRSDDSKYHYYPWLATMINARTLIDTKITEAYNEECLEEEDIKTPIEIDENYQPGTKEWYARINSNKIICKRIKSINNIQTHEGRREFTYTIDVGEGETTRVFSYNADVYEDLKHIMDIIENWYRGENDGN